VKRFKLNNERVRYLTHEEEVRLMKELADYPLLKNIVTFAICTGFRRGEIFRLKWWEVDFSVRVVRTLDKNGTPKVVPIGEKLFEMLAGLSKENEFVFPSPKTDLPLIDVKKGFKTACEDVKLENFRFHDLRHTTATRLAELGVEPFTIADILGHQDLRSTKRYTHSTSKSKRNAIVQLEQKTA
jgi:integrase